MFDQGLTDGLPVVPPTPERVLRMLSGTRRDAQDVVAIVPPNMAPATVEKIAVNAVMAGCKPEYLPVVIAALEAVCTDEFNIHGVMATTYGATPTIIVNGPIRDRIGMNSGLNATDHVVLCRVGGAQSVAGDARRARVSCRRERRHRDRDGRPASDRRSGVAHRARACRQPRPRA